MSTLDHLLDLPEQICYVQCGFCTTILLVSVPNSSLSMVVTVRCGHCTSLLSVNMMNVSFVLFHLLASLSPDDHVKRAGNLVEGSTKRALDSTHSSSEVISSGNEEEDDHIVNRVINKPPEKRQRTPSAYNRFIKEEIRRLKAESPSMSHKEAFSTAAKNWANFPPIQYQEDGDTFGQDEDNAPTWRYDALDDQVNTEGEDFNGPRHSKRAKTPF